MAGSVIERNIKMALSIEAFGFGEIDRDSLNEFEREWIKGKEIIWKPFPIKFSYKPFQPIYVPPEEMARVKVVRHSPGEVYVQSPYGVTQAQAAINTAIDGDTVIIPACNVTWASAPSWTNKNITFIGAGIDQTIITASNGSAFWISSSSKGSWRLSGMTIVMPVYNAGGWGAGYIYVTGEGATTPVSGWRMDHIRFNSTWNGTGNANHPIQIIGLTWGVIDNCTFDANGDGEQSISHYAMVYPNSTEVPAGSCSTPGSNCGKYSWENVALGLGTDSAVYVEDCTFNHSAYGMSAVNDTQYGGRMVIRHNTIYNSMVMTHSAWGPIRGGLKLEVYENSMPAPDHSYRPFLIRSGTGVIFNNTITGNYDVTSISIDNERSCLALPTYCDGSDNTYDENTPGENGWPCEDQPGTSGGAWKNQTLESWYAWNNGSYIFAPNSGCSSPQVQSGRDYINNGTTAKPGYISYTYPHPLRGPQRTLFRP